MDANYYKDLGNKAFQAKNFKDAINHYTTAISLNPNDHIFYSNRSGAYLSLQQNDEALKDAEKCLALKPDFPKGFVRKAAALCNMGKFDESIAAYRQAKYYEPNSMQYDANIQDAEKAKKYLNAFKNLPKDFPLQHYFTTHQTISGYLNDFEFLKILDFIADRPYNFLQCLSDPRVDECGKYVLYMYENLEKLNYKQVLADLNAPKPGSTTPIGEEEKILGNKFFQNKEYEKAIQQYNRGIDMSTFNLVFRSNKAACYIEMKQYDNALKTIEDAIDTFKTSPDKDIKMYAKLLFRKAKVYQLEEDYYLAIIIYNQSLNEDKTDSALKDKKECEIIYQNQVQSGFIDSNLCNSTRERGDQNYQNKNYIEAIKEYDKATKRYPKDPRAYFSKGNALVEMQELQKAVISLCKCIEVDPNFVQGYMKKGELHAQLKEPYKALETFNMGLKIDPNNSFMLQNKHRIEKDLGFVGGGPSNNLISDTAFQNPGMHQSGQRQNAPQEREIPAGNMGSQNIQGFMSDPVFLSRLQSAQTNPQELDKLMKDPKYGPMLMQLINQQKGNLNS